MNKYLLALIVFACSCKTTKSSRVADNTVYLNYSLEQSEAILRSIDLSDSMRKQYELYYNGKRRSIKDLHKLYQPGSVLEIQRDTINNKKYVYLTDPE